MAQAKRKKKFFNVEIPIIEKETQLQGYEIEEVDGRYIKYDLTRLLRGKSIELQLKVKVKEGKATAELRGVELMPYFLRRMMRKGTNYIEDSFSTTCKNAIIRIKTFLITRRKVSRPVTKELRQKAKQELNDYAKDKKTEQLFEDIVKNKWQKILSLKLKKIYPLALCEIRVLKIEKNLEETEEVKEEAKKTETNEKKKKAEKQKETEETAE
jgi:ribosomal protein S3AE